MFDIDDTLYLERDYVRSGFRATGDWLYAEHGIAGFADAAWRQFCGGSRGTIFNRTLEEVAPGRSNDAGFIQTLVDVYREHVPSIALLPDARKFLEQWSPRPMAVVSDGPVTSQQRKAEALGLYRWMDPVLLTATLGAGLGKPAPEAFQAIQRRVAARQFVYIADNPVKDFGGPRSLGWHTVRVRRPFGLHAGVPHGDDVDVEVGLLDDLPRVLDQFSKRDR